MEITERDSVINRKALLKAYRYVREFTETLCAPLEIEDYVVQPIEDVSPPKWHLGHTTWFFEQVILERFHADYRPYHPQFYFVFNSYYEAFGNRVERTARGTLSRPTVKDVYDYRRGVDERMATLIETVDESRLGELAVLVELGLNHEQQHQELAVTDIKYIFAANPLLPVYRRASAGPTAASVAPARFRTVKAGLVEIGHDSEQFAYDNESPRHTVYVEDFALMDRLVTCGEYLEFMEDGGYSKPDLWLSNGWDVLKRTGWKAPLYWFREDNTWQIITLSGARAVDLHEPLCHVSHYEAAAFARWMGKRLPTEAEWEIASLQAKDGIDGGNFVDDGHFHPRPLSSGDSADGIQQMFGDVWEWTASAYAPYPGYEQVPGPLGEYNGKFMNDQTVLRGGSCATSRNHIRATYRNFFQSDKRWQFTGLRLASDL